MLHIDVACCNIRAVPGGLYGRRIAQPAVPLCSTGWYTLRHALQLAERRCIVAYLVAIFCVVLQLAALSDRRRVSDVLPEGMAEDEVHIPMPPAGGVW